MNKEVSGILFKLNAINILEFNTYGLLPVLVGLKMHAVEPGGQVTPTKYNILFIWSQNYSTHTALSI